MKDAVITVRLPRETRARIEKLARQEGRSLSQQVERLLASALSGGDAPSSPAKLELRSLAGSLAGGRVPTMKDFRDVRAALTASMERRLEKYDELDNRYPRPRVARKRSEKGR